MINSYFVKHIGEKNINRNQLILKANMNKLKSPTNLGGSQLKGKWVNCFQKGEPWS